ncbi:2-oxoglutarate ferredoxin oxidoreductase subunit beta [Caldanaerobacter subterraneus subsp. tengcongensis MB4]|uniref:Pyruvate:ferredoxin oxidoreductase and related 2-oxoacid:ferredoxin oxidoreductases, beta subunit n=2 Tax=Caldanaerobacter subterraneus TaxID=911092 RepID=Q8RB63_CALS4|nr:2-oxoacid:ferredoxin oxidoreductase subunit beta [Caldanaerobacter subterraneus]AAM24216.1 Pyruvate:ferredoxin oxidoreductase and related 2-oxoacid:ferredoxin oxidoreductases, beta subunit [Caldanaerobacter subterraneus subsp. tengcongensis MB4]KKC29986.1 2-oxoglutarate ferredoxin oxidoreductase subunit beta [Caldanaerobacter subterraneus subsp. pacificus DSM 12653]MCS3916256.1 2-oxoglutarate ferredoxin oxidoreductase subunit beta [Caldanaerobacter subterraneus subsp. tengcongensis MB4]
MKYEYKLYEPSWCPGCGNYMIRTALKQALEELNLNPHEVVLVTGIGQGAKMPHYIKINGFNGLHGRAVPPAIGIKLANKNLKVIVESGDGDTYGEGGNHFIHAIRRNIDIAHFVHDNQIYGLTKGQASPTTAKGQKTSLQFDGVKLEPLNPIALALTMGAGFVARGFSGDIPHLVNLMKEAITYKGYALLDILQPCVVWNRVNTFAWYKERVYHLPEDYDYTNKEEAFKKAQEFGDKIPIGIIYKVEKETYEDQFDFIKNGPPLVDAELNPKNAEKLLKLFQ